MRSFTVATVALASAVSAQTAGYHAINLPGMNEEVPACSTYEIVWTPSTQYSGMVTFQLIGGSTQQTLVPIGEMFGSADGAAGKYEWSVPCDEGDDAIYGLKIHQVEDPSVFQYSMPFLITPSEDGGDNTTSTPTETPTETPDETYPSTKPTGHYGNHNSTMTPPTTFTTTTAPSNSTTSSQKPTSLTTSTAVITADSDSEPTASPETETPGSGASRAVSGSFAVLAVAAAFLAL